MGLELTEFFRVIKSITRLHPAGWVIYWTRQFGGPTEGVDRRLILSVPELEQLLGVARTAQNQRVVIHGFGLEISCMAPDSSPASRVEFVRILGGKVEQENVLGV